MKTKNGDHVLRFELLSAIIKAPDGQRKPAAEFAPRRDTRQMRQGSKQRRWASIPTNRDLVKENKVLKKTVSLILIVICIVGLTACSKNKTITDIASFDSPDGQYILVFQQVGEPFSFGPADVRLTLKEKSGAVVNSIDE
ncbi:MAG: hypothetical protein J6T77_00590, partial [Clostridia bacterium]|nr:hypothetical protein [Clostridia bacterium]